MNLLEAYMVYRFRNYFHILALQGNLFPNRVADLIYSLIWLSP
jgi:hypothetical protein